jgi:hypothetical protein
MPSLNSLSAIAGHDHEEEDWEKEMRGLRNEDEVNGACYHKFPHTTHGDTSYRSQTRTANTMPMPRTVLSLQRHRSDPTSRTRSMVHRRHLPILECDGTKA